MAELLSGIEDFIDQLSALDKKLRNQILRKALRDAAKGVAREAKANAPEDTGAMADSTKVRSGRRKKDTISVQVIVEGGHGDEPVPLHIEAGTVRLAARPFLRPALEDRKDDIRQTVLHAIKDAVDAAGK